MFFWISKTTQIWEAVEKGNDTALAKLLSKAKPKVVNKPDKVSEDNFIARL
jgi:hypothetical protein